MLTRNPAIQKLTEEKLACVVWKDGAFFVGEGIGVKPLMAFLRQDPVFFRGACVADKVVGKAAALLLVFGGAKEVYGAVMSDGAAEVLSAHSIPYSFGERTPFICNRAGDGMCPLEQAVQNITNPEEAVLALEKKISELMKSPKQ